jgi:hypothetical protein
MIADWFTTLFDANGFKPRGQCGPWTESLAQVYIFANGLTTLAYLIIAARLYAIWKRRRSDTSGGWMILPFLTFFAGCASTYACDVAAFWWPAYRLFTLASIVTAVLSVSAALWLPEVTRTLADMPSLSMFQTITSELKQAISLKENAINESRSTIVALRRQLDHLERMRKTGLWVAEQESALRELKTVLDSSSVKEAQP